MQVLENRIEEMRQYSRSNGTVIQGVPTKHDKVKDTVKHEGTSFGIDVSQSMIDACHLIGTNMY